MGRRGPPPQPTALKLAAGNPGHRPLNQSEPKPEAVTPTCPPHLSRAAKAEWKRIVPELEKLGLLTRIDRAALAAYCGSWARWVQAEKKLDKGNLVVIAPNGYETPSAWFTISRTAADQMRKFLVEFGLTPSSRSRLSVEKPKAADPLDEIRRKRDEKRRKVKSA